MLREEALLYATMPEYKALVKKTEGFIKWALSKVSNPYIACSFGKDSSVMLHLILKQMPDIRVVFAYSYETEIIDSYNSVIEEWYNLFQNLNLITILIKREDDGRLHSSEKMSKSVNHDSYFVGLRSKESTGRANSLRFQGMFYKNKDGIIRISPLAEWTERDIMAYVLSSNLPLLDTYKSFGETARTTSGIPSIGKERMLQQLKIRDMNAYNILIKNGLI